MIDTSVPSPTMIWLCAREHDDGSVVAVSGDTRRYVGSFVCGPDRPCYFPSDIGDPTHNARCGWYEQLSNVDSAPMAGEIHVEVFVNDLGEKRYSPVLPDGRRPVLGGLGGTVWISDRSTVSSRRMYRWRWTALWAARREWRFHRRSNWRPKAPYEWVDLNGREVFLYDGELATRCVSHGGSLFSGDSGVCEAVEGGLAPWMDEEFLAECEAETVWVIPATPVTVKSRVSHNSDYATTPQEEESEPE